MRICSLLPSATEIVFALGAGEQLVGVTHECDYPAGTSRISKVTRSSISASVSSAEIDAAVSSSLENSGSLYELDVPLLEQLQPELIITQRLCDVCAVSFDRVQEVASALSSHPLVLNLEPHSLGDVLSSIVVVGDAIGRKGPAEDLIRKIEHRIDAVREMSQTCRSRPRVFCMEWVDPPFCGGHWMKELVEIAGGNDELANSNRPSIRVKWSDVVRSSPEVIVLTCCGFSLQRCMQEAEVLGRFEGVFDLPAVKARRVFATDGSAYFSRPGPRIVDSLEILAHLVHPEIFAPPPLPGAFSSVDLRSLLSI